MVTFPINIDYKSSGRESSNETPWNPDSRMALENIPFPEKISTLVECCLQVGDMCFNKG